MRKMLVPKLCGTKSEFITFPDLALAHQVVSGLESLSKRIGRESRRRHIPITQRSECGDIVPRELSPFGRCPYHATEDNCRKPFHRGIAGAAKDDGFVKRSIRRGIHTVRHAGLSIALPPVPLRPAIRIRVEHYNR